MNKQTILDDILFKDLIDYSNDMVWILNMADMGIEYVNKTTCDEMGYTLEEMQELGMGKLRKSLPNSVSFSEHLEELKTTDSGMTDYAILVRKDSSEFYIEVKARIVKIDETEYNLAMVRNISDRVDLLEKMQKQSKRMESYLDISKVLIMALDNQKNIIMINQAGSELLGYEKDELIGKNFIETCIPKTFQEDIDRVANDIIKLKSTHDGHVNEIITKNGVKKLISWKNSTLYDDDQNPIGVLTSGEDITEISKVQKQLQVQTKQAQMGEMISMIAHQWRQPLSSISAATMSIQFKQEVGDYDKEYYDEKLHFISEIVQHLSKTIDDFRDFFKEDKKASSISMDELIDGSVHIIESIFTSKGISIEYDYADKSSLHTYPNECRQVILNILKNAQEAFEENNVQNPCIKIKSFKKDNQHCISIEDNAGGIPKDVIDNIFEPYFTTKDEYNGTGIGLYMSKTIIEKHCMGEINVKNHNDGVLFSICLPESISS